MKPLGLILAGVGAILGALAWGLISWSTSYEIGIIAWGIGLLVGVCGLVGGSDGVAGGVACAILALASIGLGKYLGVSWVISGLTSSSEFTELFENSLTQENFEDLKGHAKVFERVKSPRDYPKFMKNRGFSEGEPSPQDVAFFADETAPMLRRISEGDLDYEVWKAERIDQVKLAFEEVRPSTMEAMQDSFSIYDVLWAFLGVSTAFRVGSGAVGDD